MVRTDKVRARAFLRLAAFLIGRAVTIVAISLLVIFAVYMGMLILVRRETISDAPLAIGDYGEQALLHTRVLITNLFNGQLGTVQELSGRYTLVSDILSFTFRNSLGLLLPALLLATLAGILMGIVAALTRSRQRQISLVFLSFLGVAAPSFLIAVALQTLVIRYTQHFGSRLMSVGGYGWDWDHMLLPLLVLAARPTAYIARATYISLLEVMRQDYIRTAFAKGLSLRRTVLTHALRNLAIPLLTAIAVSLRFSLSALPIVEYIFAWPGMGRRLLEAIQDPTPLLVVTIALIISLMIQVVSMLLEFSYRFIDPRIREAL